MGKTSQAILSQMESCLLVQPTEERALQSLRNIPQTNLSQKLLCWRKQLWATHYFPRWKCYGCWCQHIGKRPAALQGQESQTHEGKKMLLLWNQRTPSLRLLQETSRLCQKQPECQQTLPKLFCLKPRTNWHDPRWHLYFLEGQHVLRTDSAYCKYSPWVVTGKRLESTF